MAEVLAPEIRKAFSKRIHEIGEDYAFFQVERLMRKDLIKPGQIEDVLPHVDPSRVVRAKSHSPYCGPSFELFGGVYRVNHFLYHGLDEEDVMGIIKRAEEGKILFSGERPIPCEYKGPVARIMGDTEDSTALAMIDIYRAHRDFERHHDSALLKRHVNYALNFIPFPEPENVC